MEQLPKATQESIRKASTVRLQLNLVRADVDEETVVAMDRQQLMAAWAQMIVEGTDKPVEAVPTARIPAGYDPEVERERLQWEREKFERKMKMSEEKLKLKAAQMEEKLQIDRAALKFQQQKDGDEAAKLKKYSEALRGTIPKQTNDPLEVVAFFRNVERLFHDFKVPAELQGALIKPFLTERAKSLVAKLDPAKASYGCIKEALLREYKVSAPMYREKFNELDKKDDETYVMYVSSLTTLIDGYIEARKVTQLDELRDLMVSDRMKAALKPAILRYVLSVEANSKKGWIKPYELAEVADDYIANYHDPISPKSGVLGMLGQSGKMKGHPVAQGGRQIQTAAVRQSSGNNAVPPLKFDAGLKKSVSCYNCGGPHLVRFCPKSKGVASLKSSTGRVNKTFVQNSHSTFSKSAVEPVEKNFTADDIARASDLISARPADTVCGDADMPTRPTARRTDNFTTAADVDIMSASDVGLDKCSCDIKRAAIECANAVSDIVDQSEFVDVVKHPLSYINIGVALPQTPAVRIRATALRDSGSECSLISNSVLKQLPLADSIGEVKISGISGDPVICPLVRLKVFPAKSDTGIIITAAVFDKLTDDMVLPTVILQRLDEITELDSTVNDSATGKEQNDNLEIIPNVTTEDHNVNVITRSGLSTETVAERPENNASSPVIEANTNDHVISDFQSDNSVIDEAGAEARAQLAQQQKMDPSLQHCWSLLKRGKGNFYLQNEVLMRSEKVLGQHYSQLVVPTNRRQQCLEFGHDLAGHMSPKKVSQRLRLSFWWPTMKENIHDYVRHCEVCQLHGRKTCWDRVPIQATERHGATFMHWHIDVLGPMSSEKMLYPYCLLLLDSYSRFPAAYALKAPTAKNICDCLINLWTFVGVPQYVSLDNASYNVAGLTTELFKRFAVTPKFITPHHSEGNAAAERLIGTAKRLIAKVAAQNPNSWHKHLPFVMWALREVPSELTGVPPWLLAMGTLPRGPLAVLRESWLGDLPPKLGKAPEQYLRELHHNLEVAKHYADAHSKRMQKVYVDRYNKRSRDKCFRPGDSVLILEPKSTTSRMFTPWKGPARVIERLSPYSYLVELDGARYRLHANHLKRFFTEVNEIKIDSYGFGGPNSLSDEDATMVVSSTTQHATLNPNNLGVQVATCAVIRDEDVDFGEVRSYTPPAQVTLLPSQRLEPSTIAHLSEVERQQLLDVLDKYADVFKDEPGLYTGVEHQIPVTDDFRPRRMREYKIPEKIKPEVMKQIEDLLSQGIIRPSTSPMASPLVCLLKGPSGRDGVRLAVDFRYVNRHTISDAFPIGDIEEIIQRIGNSTCISVCDCSSGYWQTMCAEGDRWKTGFICDNQLYEWTRTPFGLKSSGQTFCRAAQQILQPIKDIAAAFVDDMAVHSNGFTQHLKDLERYLAVMRKAGMTLKLKKCRFALPEIKYCGEIIGSGQRRPDREKLAAVDAIKMPESKKQVRQILGFFNYFRDSIPHFAEMAKALTDLTKKMRPNKVHCGEKEMNAVQQLKNALCRAVENPRHIIDPSKDFNLLVDAAHQTVAGVLTQTSDSGVEQPIAFFSWKLNDTQQNWATVEKEAYAALKALQRVKQWVFGHRISVYSDHNPLTYLTESAPKSSKLLRWALALQEFDITFKYRAGKFNVVPDVLTRLCHDELE